MFYSQFILAKKGPLGTIWIAAHLERKLRKNEVANTDIGISVDSILSPNVPIALRLSSHLLLGVARIYSRKVNYLFDDCSETLLSVRQTFRSAAVDLPPEESKAPYHSITLPETFDLDDFELPDNEFQGNFVDHHISSRDQITLQDNIEGTGYSMSKFGLDERFGDGDGDGDGSGLNLDEELFLEIGTTGHANESSDPQASVVTMTTLKQDEHPETTAVNLGTRVDDDDDDDCGDPMDYAEAPSTPGLVEEPNLLSNAQQEVSDHLETECPLVDPTITENVKNNTYGDKQEFDWCSHENNANSDAIPIEADVGRVSADESSLVSKPIFDHLETECPLVDPTITENAKNNTYGDKQEVDWCSHDNNANSVAMPIEADVECVSADESLLVSKPIFDLSLNLELELADKIDKSSDLYKPNDDHLDPNEIVLEKSDFGISEGDLEKKLNLDVGENFASTENIFLRPCNNSNQEKPDTVSGCVKSTDGDVQSNVAALENPGREETVMLGEACCVTDNSEGFFKENHVQEHASQEDVHAASREPESQLHNENSHDELAKNLNNSTETELPAPEKLLSVPEGLVDLSCGAFFGLDEGDAGRKINSGKKRSFTESTLTKQSLNSAEASRLVRFKRTVESVPDDEDLLSSILVGNSLVLKVKPTPRRSKVTSMKRTRSAPRTGPLKRKLLMDEMMVLHGDMIRQQLTNTKETRRVRKKAPCTSTEISMIQKQYLEDEFFLQPIFTGMSSELVSLHGQTCDLSRITVVKNDLNGSPSLEPVAELRLPSENNENALETKFEPILASHDVKNDYSLETASEPYVISQIDETKEANEINEEINVSGEQTKPTADVEADISQQELLLDVTEVQISEINDNPVNIIADIASASIVQPGFIIETVDTNPSFSADTSAGQKTDVPSAELDAISQSEFTAVNDGDINVEVENEPEAKDGDVLPETEYIEHGEFYSVVSEDGFVNNGENNPEETKYYERHTMDSEISGFDLHDREELNYSVAGNDTEFLNFDDDELNEIGDDHIPDDDDEEEQFIENTGWSSRTRAVSKYLQTLFVKEADFGKESLSMHNLLIGKSRKEASRMFFEALVLKTRDYIHVEQSNPFNDISLKPRTRLMKSDF